jgi:type IV pilus assembly protein PilX
MSSCRTPGHPQRGFALVTSIILLMIVTILALGMFRGFATQEHIAGNLREKERAFHAAVSAEQYAEWWLLQSGNTAGGGVTCAGTSIMNANASQGQVCNLTPALSGYTVAQPSTWGWYTNYTPPGMSIGAVNATNSNGDTMSSYVSAPAFWIADVGPSGDGAGEAYQIDAYSYGATTNTVAVVESVYELQQGMINRGGL